MLAENITTEQGKTLKDAWGDVFRGLGWFFHDLTPVFAYLVT
jgi:hypothetical protein